MFPFLIVQLLVLLESILPAMEQKGFLKYVEEKVWTCSFLKVITEQLKEYR